jgi:hypothetical protein
MLILSQKQQQVIATFDDGIESVLQERDKHHPRTKTYHVLNAKIWELKYQRLQCINQWLMGNDVKLAPLPTSKVDRLLKWLRRS